jgi:hypothetical protein
MSEYCSPEKDKAALITISAQHDFVQAGSPLCAKGHIRAVPVLSRVVEGFIVPTVRTRNLAGAPHSRKACAFSCPAPRERS